VNPKVSTCSNKCCKFCCCSIYSCNLKRVRLFWSNSTYSLYEIYTFSGDGYEHTHPA